MFEKVSGKAKPLVLYNKSKTFGHDMTIVRQSNVKNHVCVVTYLYVTSEIICYFFKIKELSFTTIYTHAYLHIGRYVNLFFTSTDIKHVLPTLWCRFSDVGVHAYRKNLFSYILSNKKIEVCNFQQNLYCFSYFFLIKGLSPFKSIWKFKLFW